MEVKPSLLIPRKLAKNLELSMVVSVKKQVEMACDKSGELTFAIF